VDSVLHPVVEEVEGLCGDYLHSKKRTIRMIMMATIISKRGDGGSLLPIGLPLWSYKNVITLR
jgi:hypothetical protein